VKEEMAGQPPPADHRLDGFQVRAPRPEERTPLLAFFPNNPLGSQDIHCLGAFGQPGDVPLGATIVRASRGRAGSIGQFLIFVRPECRRRKIGKMLMRHLYALARANNAKQLLLAELVHEERVDNAFYRACGMTPERSFATYSLPLDDLMTLIAPITRRLQRSDSLLAAMRIEPLAALNLTDVAAFFSSNYSGFADRRLAQFHSGVYDLAVSCAAVHEGRIIAGCLCRTRAGETSGLLDLILTGQDFRNNALPLLLFAHCALTGMEKGITHSIFEADESYDHFAIGIARRLKINPQWHRHRYSINHPEIASRSRNGF
jgi:GNAT superfamily N-acetyltransferase